LYLSDLVKKNDMSKINESAFILKGFMIKLKKCSKLLGKKKT